MTIEEKVLCCHGNLVYTSIAKVVDIPYWKVCTIMYKNNKRVVRKNQHRQDPYSKNKQ